MNPENISLALFLTRAVPLEIWRQTGTLGREIGYYRELASRLGHVSMVTCGNENEVNLVPSINNISILYNKWKISPNLYSFLAPFLHRKSLVNANIYKTNQLDGAWTALIAGWMFRKPVIVRAGYIWSDFFRQEGGKGFRAILVEFLEKWCLRRARRIFVTTQEIKDRYSDKYSIPKEKIVVIPNYVDTQIFHPDSEITPIKNRICFVGRLDPIKNADLLIQALAQIPDVSLTIIGQGKQLEGLKSLSSRLHANVDFLGQIENASLPQEIHKSAIFVLPSSLEGHPKALLEAMACGSAVIGADVPGIRNLIRHKENGLLCPPTLEGIRDAITRLLENDSLRTMLGNNAADFVKKTYSLDKVAALETAAVLECLTSDEK